MITNPKRGDVVYWPPSGVPASCGMSLSCGIIDNVRLSRNQNMGYYEIDVLWDDSSNISGFYYESQLDYGSHYHVSSYLLKGEHI